MRPQDLLTFHVESIIRMKGAKHLSPEPLSLVSNLLMDVAIVILVPIVAINAFFIFILWKCCCKNKKESKKIDKKQKKQ